MENEIYISQAFNLLDEKEKNIINALESLKLFSTNIKLIL
jgi:hypothetical protein